MPSEEHDLIAAIEAAVAADESNVVLRTHLARLLVDAGRPAEALNHASRVLIAAPEDKRTTLTEVMDTIVTVYKSPDLASVRIESEHPLEAAKRALHAINPERYDDDRDAAE